MTTMLILLALMLLTHNTQSGEALADSADTCGGQENCFHVEVTAQDARDEDASQQDTYEICLYWNSASKCPKRVDEVISCVAIPSDDESDLENAIVTNYITNWKPETDNKQCQTVGCSEGASFAVQNGDADCGKPDHISTSDVDTYINNHKASCTPAKEKGTCGETSEYTACEWTIYAPACEVYDGVHKEDDASDNEGGLRMGDLSNSGHVSNSMFIMFASILACVLLITLCVCIWCKIMQCRGEPIVKNDVNEIYLDVEQSVNENEKEDEEMTVVTLKPTA